MTGCIKHYMGVPQGSIVPSVHPSIPHEHFSIAQGGLATLMVETRAPVLNILDMIWINANPLESSSTYGPMGDYAYTSFTDIIGVSQDPVALDYWASKNVLMPTAMLDYDSYSSLDPDYELLSGSGGMIESFHNYLRRSKDVLIDAGLQTTMNQTEMNVFINVLNHTNPYIGRDQLDPAILIIIILPISAGMFVLLVLFIKHRKK
ncbi:MAG: DUF362 domain-containing protein [Candidatus Hermodarchaeota archaeon]